MRSISTTPGIYGPEVDRPEERRRDALRQMLRDTRKTLATAPAGKLHFAQELLSIYAGHQLTVSLAVPGLALITAIILTIWMPLAQTAAWFSGTLAATAICVMLCRQYLRAAPEEADLPRWRGMLTAAEFLHAVSWAVLAFLGGNQQEPAFHVFIFAVMIIVVAVRSMFAVGIRAVIYAGTVPISAALMLRFSLMNDILYWAMAAIAAGAQVYFAALAMRLARSVSAMIEFRAEKEALIAELEQATAAADEARQRAEEANIAKSRFLATMSHELRTPLNAILGFSEIMKNEVFGPHENPNYRDYAVDIHRSGEHLLNLINEILDLSRIEAGRYELTEEPIKLAHVVEDCLRLVALRAREKHIQLGESFEPDMPKLTADERAVRQMCLNLLSNAIKFTPAGGQVTVKAGWTEGGGQYVSVRDTGPGIPPEEIPQILTSFGQGSLAQKTAEQGAGLGLPIVQGLIELHGGALSIDSRLREGTEVTVTFPRERILFGEEQRTGGNGDSDGDGGSNDRARRESAA